jgi:predicted YcjX-like family ATPase
LRQHAKSSGWADSTRAISVARLTLTLSTPGTAASTRSTLPTQEAQLMPSILIAC